MPFSSIARLSCALCALCVLSIWSAGCGGGSGGGPNPIPTSTPTAGPTATPTPRPIGTNPIAFVSNRDGNGEIYIMNSDGSTQTRLTRAAGDDIAPSQSRDGQFIVFESSRDGNAEIYLMNRDGSNERRFTRDTGTTRPTDKNPVFSPDSQTIAWSSARGGIVNIWLMDATGDNQRRLTNESLGASNPVFSPDGTRIAYVVRRSTGRELELRNLATNAVTTTSIRFLGEPDHLRFNMAGTRLIYSDQPTGAGGTPRLFVADLTNNTVSSGPSASARNFDPDFSPTGNSIVWSAGSATPQIYVINEQGVNPGSLTSRGANTDPDW